MASRVSPVFLSMHCKKMKAPTVLSRTRKARLDAKKHAWGCAGSRDAARRGLGAPRDVRTYLSSSYIAAVASHVASEHTTSPPDPTRPSPPPRADAASSAPHRSGSKAPSFSPAGLSTSVGKASCSLHPMWIRGATSSTGSSTGSSALSSAALGTRPSRTKCRARSTARLQFTSSRLRLRIARYLPEMGRPRWVFSAVTVSAAPHE